MSAAYPSSVKVFASRSNGQVIDASHVGDLQDEVAAIEAGILQGSAPISSSNLSANNSTFAGVMNLLGQPIAVVYHTATQSVNDSTPTALTFNSEDINVGSMHSTSSNPTRVTVASSGTYEVTCAYTVAPNSSGYRQSDLRKNGSSNLAEKIDIPTNVLTVTIFGPAWVGRLDAADYIELTVLQTSGAALNYGSATRANANTMTVKKIR